MHACSCLQQSLVEPSERRKLAAETRVRAPRHLFNTGKLHVATQTLKLARCCQRTLKMFHAMKMPVVSADGREYKVVLRTMHAIVGCYIQSITRMRRVCMQQCDDSRNIIGSQRVHQAVVQPRHQKEHWSEAASISCAISFGEKFASSAACCPAGRCPTSDASTYLAEFSSCACSTAACAVGNALNFLNCFLMNCLWFF